MASLAPKQEVREEENGDSRKASGKGSGKREAKAVAAEWKPQSQTREACRHGAAQFNRGFESRQDRFVAAPGCVSVNLAQAADKRQRKGGAEGCGAWTGARRCVDRLCGPRKMGVIRKGATHGLAVA